MPVTKSAAKAARQNLKHYKRNLAIKRRMKSDIKSLVAAIRAGNNQKVAEALQTAQSSIDKAVKNNLIHANKASRQKSQLAKMIAAKPAKSTTKTATKKSSAKKPAAKAATKKIIKK